MQITPKNKIFKKLKFIGKAKQRVYIVVFKGAEFKLAFLGLRSLFQSVLAWFAYEGTPIWQIVVGIRKDTPLVQRISGQTTTVFFKILKGIAKIANSKKKNYDMYFILIFVITMIVVGGLCKNSGCSQNCNPATGDCYCDATHKLRPDKKTCAGNVLKPFTV